MRFAKLYDYIPEPDRKTGAGRKCAKGWRIL